MLSGFRACIQSPILYTVENHGISSEKRSGLFYFWLTTTRMGFKRQAQVTREEEKIFFSFASIRASRALHSKLRSFKCKQLSAEQYFPVVLFIVQHKVVLTSESLSEILCCDHSNESYWAVLSCGTVNYAV